MRRVILRAVNQEDFVAPVGGGEAAFQRPAAWRADLDGVPPGVPKFWNVHRSG